MMEGNEGTEEACLQLAIEGEKLMDKKLWSEAVRYFEAAITLGTDNIKLLNVIYYKLWTLYHHLKTYDKALQYAHYQLELARVSKEFDKEAFSSARIGITLSMMNRFEEACCTFESLLDIAQRKKHDCFTEIALYHLGQTKFKCAKHLEAAQAPSHLIQQHLTDAVSYFLRYKEVIGDSRDAPIVGKVCGSLAHVYFKLDDFENALACQLECLKISLEFGDQEIQQSSNSFLGTIYCSMHKYSEAADAFEQSFYLAEQLDDDTRKAKALYSLANVMSLLEDHETAIDLSTKYLELVKSIGDDVGESHVYCFMCRQYRFMGNLHKSLQYAQKYQDITKKMRDTIGYKLAAELCEEISAALVSQEESLNRLASLDDSELLVSEGGAYSEASPVATLNGHCASSASFSEHFEVNVTDLDQTSSNEHTFKCAHNASGDELIPQSPEKQDRGCLCAPHVEDVISRQKVSSISPREGDTNSTLNFSKQTKHNHSDKLTSGHTNTTNIDPCDMVADEPHVNGNLIEECDEHKYNQSDNFMVNKGALPSQPKNGLKGGVSQKGKVQCRSNGVCPMQISPVRHGGVSIRDAASSAFFRSPQIKRASRAGSEFEFDPFILANRKKSAAHRFATSAGSNGVNASAMFRAEECESLYDLITKAQGVGRIDEQRLCLERLSVKGGKGVSKGDMSKSSNKSNSDKNSTTHGLLRATKSHDSTIVGGCENGATGDTARHMTPDQLIDQIARSQSYRMNDQRSEVTLLPGLCASPRNQDVIERARSQQLNFLDLLERCQNSRFDDQRTVLPPLPESVTLPESEFLDTIQRVQISGRMDEQRTSLPPPPSAATASSPYQRTTTPHPTRLGPSLSAINVSSTSSPTNTNNNHSIETSTAVQRSSSAQTGPTPSTSIFRMFRRTGSRKNSTGNGFNKPR